MSRRKAWWLAALLAVCAASHPGIAHAANDTAAAQALFEEARALMAKGDYGTACTKLEGSEALDPGAGTEYNLALCYDKAGRSASAWATYLTAAASYKATNRPEWETKARDRANVLAPTLSRVTLVLAAGTPADVAITRDGAKVLSSELGAPIPLDPGRHVIEATAGDRPKWSTTFDLAASSKLTIEVSVPAQKTTSPTTAPPPAPPTAADASQPADPGAGRRMLAYGLGAGGIVGLGLGTGAGLAAINENSASKKACPNDGPCADVQARNDNGAARDWATVSTVSFIAGGALLTGAVILFFTAPKASTARATITPVIGPGSAGVAGTF